jgi:hypothetical protein
MDNWRRSTEARAHAWDYLRVQVRPDVALLQEADPSGHSGGVVFRQGGLSDDRSGAARDLGWGSAVVSFGPSIRTVETAISPFRPDPNPLLRTFPGSVAVAEVGSVEPLVVVSVYGLIDRGYADTTVHRILSDLTPLIDERRGRRMIIAGDLNLTTQWSARHRSTSRGLHKECLARDQNVFARFDALGFRNVVLRAEPLSGCGCSAGPACRHVQTQRHDRSTFPWQNDYIFVTSDIYERTPTLEVFDRDDAWALSGHCPIVIEFADS